MNWKDKFREALASKPLQYMILAFVVVGLLLWAGIYIGKAKVTGKQASYPKGDTIPDQWVKLQAPIILKNLGDTLLGVSILTANKAQALKPLLTISDVQLTYIYNEYNNLYHPGTITETLYKDIEDDYFGTDFFEEGQVRTKTLQRMLGLNLK
ncbi:hypothetical protein [Fibrella forsythiae]|uniref:Uncharacterized protein n=1 Tax=Fibrella forsythiae TaxID=2817061 RepID=A0ABS3JMF6_9BACT|nr:hypothetical protein [Fibrella forsythiae]MBO0951202.1 hypothetical protein [Fibrella forsythiae]